MHPFDVLPRGADAHRVLEPLRAFVIRRVEPSAIDDVMQNIWLRLQRGVGRLRDPERLRAWTYRVARSAIADHWAERHRHGAALAEHVDLEAPVTAVKDGDPMETCSQSIRRMVAQLPPKYRDVLELTELEPLPYAEAASRLGISMAALKSRALRGRVKLRAAFERCCRVELDRRGALVVCERRASSCRSHSG